MALQIVGSFHPEISGVTWDPTCSWFCRAHLVRFPTATAKSEDSSPLSLEGPGVFGISKFYPSLCGDLSLFLPWDVLLELTLDIQIPGEEVFEPQNIS